MHKLLNAMQIQILHMCIHQVRQYLTELNIMLQYSHQISNYQLSHMNRVLISQLMLMFYILQAGIHRKVGVNVVGVDGKFKGTWCFK